MVLSTVLLRRAGFALGLISLLLATTARAADLYEAEAARLTGNLRVATTVQGASGGSYVTGFQSGADNLYFDLVAAEAFGLYEVTIGYHSPYGNKNTRIYANGQAVGEVFLAGSVGFKEVSAGKLLLNQGANVIRLESNWGYYDIDYIKVQPAEKRGPHQADKRLINPNASLEAKALMSYLVDQYGKSIISGQQDTDDLGYIAAQTGKLPAMLGLDFMDYSPSRVERGTRSTDTETGIDWANNQGGLVTYCWHWNAPKGLLDTPEQRWWSGFYTSATTFDIAYALANPQSEDYALILRDIDAIAVQLKRLEAAKVPVLWRPLHEAEGRWFWWGAKGPEACKALWKLMYDRLTNLHGINNLIWVWNSIDPAWYPGDEYVDIVSMDSYPGNFNYTAQGAAYERLVNLTGHTKLIAMTENGPVPDPNLVKVYDARWSWFCTWVNFPRTGNSVEHLQRVFNDPYVLTLEDMPTIASYPLTGATEIRSWLMRFQRADELGGGILVRLVSKLKQAESFVTKGQKTQAITHMQQFLAHLERQAVGADLSADAKATLTAYANLMIQELSR